MTKQERKEQPGATKDTPEQENVSAALRTMAEQEMGTKPEEKATAPDTSGQKEKNH